VNRAPASLYEECTVLERYDKKDVNYLFETGFKTLVFKTTDTSRL
jgi:hypothetical protein